MPAVSEIDTLVPPADENAKPQKVETANTNDPNKREINPVVVAFINKILNGGTSAGAIGVATMLITCLLLCKNMEEAFNSIWGVRKGRKWVDRIVFYFALIFFGSVGTICGMTFLGGFATCCLYKRHTICFGTYFVVNIPCWYDCNVWSFGRVL